MIDYKAVIKKNEERQRRQIAAGTHTTCPVCMQHVQVRNSRIALHYDIVANNIDVPCVGSRKAVVTAVAGSLLKSVIAENKLSTTTKYEAYRKAHPELSLPKWQQVAVAYNECGGWNFTISGIEFRKTSFGSFKKFSSEMLQKAVQ